MKGYLLGKKVFDKNFYAHRTPGGTAVVCFLLIQLYFLSRKSLYLLHRIKLIFEGKLFMTSKYASNMQIHIDQQRGLLYYDAFSSNLVICLIFYISISMQQNSTEPNLIRKTLYITKKLIKFRCEWVSRWHYYVQNIFLGFPDIFCLSQENLDVSSSIAQH